MNLLNLFLTLMMQGGGGTAQSARTFFRWLFLHEIRGLEVRNFLTFPDSLKTFWKLFFTVFWCDLEGADTLCKFIVHSKALHY